MAALLALLVSCGGSGTALQPCALTPGWQLTARQCSDLAGLALPEALPPARGNQYADSTDAAVFGHRVFFDARFSRDLSVRCASCHLTERSFQDATPTPKSFAVARNTPTIINAARLGPQFWDGRADSLWSQALFALENPDEMNFTRLEIAHLLDTTFRASYEKAFGPLPDFSDTARFPEIGAPGSPAFDHLAAADQDLVNRVVANLGKALEAYARRATAGASALDRHLSGDATALNPLERQGLSVFAKAGCLGCHSGPMLTDEKFHNLGVPAWPGVAEDPGRSAGLSIVLANPFNARGAFFDGPPPADQADYLDSPDLLGAFRTPSLRNLGRTAPYGHNGRYATLEEVVDFHLQGGGRGGAGYSGTVDKLLTPQAISTDDRAALLAFLRALDGKYPGLPWSDWPRG